MFKNNNVGRLSMKNNKGFSIIEVMITLGLIGITSAAILSLVTNMNNILKSSDNKVAELGLITEINQVITDKDMCKKSLNAAGAQNINLTAPFKIKLKHPSKGIISEGTTVDNNLLIKELYVDSFETPSDTAIAGQKKTLGTLWLKVEDVNKKTIERRTKSVGLINLIYLDATKEIVDCFAIGLTPKNNCESLGFVWHTSTQTCRQAPSQSCSDIGGTWSGGKCVISAVSDTLSILNKSCSGTNVALVGFDSAGNPKCQTISAGSSGGSGGSGSPPAPPADPSKGPCLTGFTNVPSPNGSNTCYFEWPQTVAGGFISTQQGTLNATKGGSGSATCLGDNKWNVVYVCPNTGGKVACLGGSHTMSSQDNTNTCTFSWAQGQEGESIKLTSTAAQQSGGTLSATCQSNGVWTYNYGCPGKGIKYCPAGAEVAVPSNSQPSNPAKTCRFTWNTTPVGSPAVSLRDTSGNGGSGSGWICKGDLTYTTGTVNCP